MGSPAELTLGCLSQAAHPTGTVYKNVSPLIDTFDVYLCALLDERRKIEAFKRELPHCMQLLDYAIEASKEHLGESQHCSLVSEKIVDRQGEHAKRLLEEFLKKRWESLRKENDDVKEKPKKCSNNVEPERPAWMAEAQLWAQPPAKSDQRKEKDSQAENTLRRQRDSTEQSTVTSPGSLFTKQRQGGAFLPYIIKEKQAPPIVARPNVEVADLGLSSGESRQAARGFGAVESEVGSIDVSTRDVGMEISQGKETLGRVNGGCGNHSGAGSTSSGGGQGQRKARRCWSPELHRRFVNALQQLGGSQIATPKQIRELMKVDGLTNDEVKSHLQKYRLHTRRPSPAPQSTQQSAPQLVVLGGIWVPPEYANSGLYHDPATSVCQQPARFCQPSVSQEFYSQLNPSPKAQDHPSHSHSSPQGPLQSTSQVSGAANQASGEAYREDSGGEEGKSESSSWKGENESQGRRSEDENAEREALQSGRDDDDETDSEDERENEITLQLKISCSRA